MTRRTLLAAGLAAGLSSLAPAAAHAAACPKMVAKASKPSAITDYNASQPEGGALRGAAVKFPGHFFETSDTVNLRIKGNTFRIAEGSTFKLTCYGKSKADKRRFPAVDLLIGEVKATTSARNPGGVVTEEGLYDPRSDPSMVFTVSRTLTQTTELTLDEQMSWFAGFDTQPTGTTEVVSNSKAIIGVTPYVGPDPGRCRYVDSAKLTTKGRYGKGTASYET